MLQAGSVNISALLPIYHFFTLIQGISYNIKDLSKNEMTMAKPIEAISKGESFKPGTQTAVSEPVTMASFSFKLTRLGSYVLCVLVEDRNSKLTAQAEVPFTVYKP